VQHTLLRWLVTLYFGLPCSYPVFVIGKNKIEDDDDDEDDVDWNRPYECRHARQRELTLKSRKHRISVGVEFNQLK